MRRRARDRRLRAPREPAPAHGARRRRADGRASSGCTRWGRRRSSRRHRRSAATSRAARHAGARAAPRCSGSRCSRRSSSASCSPCSSRSASCAATPSSVCCSRSSSGRSGRTTLLLARFSAAVLVCVPYVLVVYAVAALITGADAALAAARSRRAGARARRRGRARRGAALLGATLLQPIANGVAVFMLFGAGLVAGLLGQIGQGIGSRTLERIGERSSWVVPFEGLYQDALHRIAVRLERPHPGRAQAGAVRRRAGGRRPDLRLAAVLPRARRRGRDRRSSGAATSSSAGATVIRGRNLRGLLRGRRGDRRGSLCGRQLGRLVVLAGDGVLELAHPGAERAPDLRQPLRAEEQQRDDEQEDELRRARRFP